MLIAILALVVGLPVLVTQIMVETAPEGYQDDLGWHAGTPVSRNLRNSLHPGSDTVA